MRWELWLWILKDAFVLQQREVLQQQREVPQQRKVPQQQAALECELNEFQTLRDPG